MQYRKYHTQIQCLFVYMKYMETENSWKLETHQTNQHTKETEINQIVGNTFWPL